MNKGIFIHRLCNSITVLIGAGAGGVTGVIANILVFGWFSESSLVTGFMTIQWLQLTGVLIGMLFFVLGSILPTSQLHSRIFKSNSRLSMFVGVLIGGFGFGMVIFYVFLR